MSYNTIQAANNIGADQTARMRRLIFAFDVRIWHNTRFCMTGPRWWSSRYLTYKYFWKNFSHKANAALCHDMLQIHLRIPCFITIFECEIDNQYLSWNRFSPKIESQRKQDTNRRHYMRVSSPAKILIESLDRNLSFNGAIFGSLLE